MTLPLSSSARSAAGALVALVCAGVSAQPLPSTCTDLLAVAEARYAEQVYIDVEPLMRDCIAGGTATPQETQQAYRLLARTYIKQGMMAEARRAIVELLGVNPSYTADPRIDLPSYVAVAREAREQVSTLSGALASTDAPARPAARPAAPAPPRPGVPREDPRDAAPALVDVNTASAEALDAVPGIGPALAARIVAHREQNGAFGSAAELENVRGIGPRSIAQMLPHLTAGGTLAAPVGSASAEPARLAEGVQALININTATAEELEALPGIGPALAHGSSSSAPATASSAISTTCCWCAASARANWKGSRHW